MKNLHMRFILYCTAGLFLFLIYFLFLFTFLNTLINPNGFVMLSYESVTIANILVFIFCFATGGLLFSMFIVQPLSRIIRTINELSHGKYNTAAAGFMKDGKIKWYYFLYQEVILNIAALGKGLEQADNEQKELDQAKNDWIAGVSHDLKTPLSYINGYSSLLLNENHQFSEQERTTYISEIYKKGVYIEELINELNLTFFFEAVGNQQLRYSQIELISFLQNILADVVNDPKAEKYVIEYVPSISRKMMVLDEELMRRAMHNLLMNAVEHNPKGTRITVRVEQRAKQICIEIADDGDGLTERAAGRIFDKYFSTKEQEQSKGLGLFVVKQVIKAHDGDITVSSKIGKGTIFHVFLSDKEDRN